MADGALGFLQFLSIGSLVMVLGSLLSALVYPYFRGAIRGCHPAIRSRAIICYGFVSPAVAVTVVALLMHPDFSQLLVPGHCHDGACGSHTPVMNASSAGGLSLVAGSSLLLAGTLFAGLYGVRTAQRRLKLLFGVAQRAEYKDVLVVESPDLFAWCCGIWNARILVSRGLIQQLSPQQLQLVLAHERAHERRMDNLRALTLRCLTVFWPPSSRSRIRAALAGDVEVACDLDVVGMTDNSDNYIEVLGQLHRSRAAATANSKGTGFGCRETAKRIEALTKIPTNYHDLTAGITILCVLWFLQVAAATGLTHYLVEWIAALGVLRG